MIRTFALVLALSACAPAWEGPVTPDQRPHIVNGPGGFIGPIMAMRQAMIERGDRPVICGAASAHTSLVSVPGACACPGDDWLFHGASIGGQWNRAATEQLAATYPPALRDWFWRSGAAYLTGAEYAPLTAQDLAQIGAIQICEGEV